MLDHRKHAVQTEGDEILRGAQLLLLVEPEAGKAQQRGGRSEAHSPVIGRPGSALSGTARRDQPEKAWPSRYPSAAQASAPNTCANVWPAASAHAPRWINTNDSME